MPDALLGIDTVFFDLDGTLLDESGLPAAVRGACEVIAAGAELAVDDLLASNTRVWADLWPEVYEEWMIGAVDVGALGTEAWRQTLAGCGVRDEDAVRLAVTTHEQLERRAHRVYPDAVAVLDALRERGVRIGLVTNGAAAVQRAKLRAVELESYFDPLIISSEVGVMKPQPGIFEHALVQAGTTPDRAAMVGDHLWHDVEAAQSAGLRGVWIDRRGVEPKAEWPRPNVVVPGLAHLLAR
ncbi:HAD family hydrolase [uncultured Amnibacterium sp.]|uniref:HAD family hydrolase n=1 Tax=uncultured Amnibacterium sp. TaxID=1631851 RepID=UPI0035C96956